LVFKETSIRADSNKKENGQYPMGGLEGRMPLKGGRHTKR